MRRSTRAARRPRMTTPMALTMAIIVVVLKEPLGSSRVFRFAIVILSYPLFDSI
jgi:hypothetical protein